MKYRFFLLFKRYLLKLWNRLNNLEGHANSEENAEGSDAKNDVLECYLDTYFQKDSPCPEAESAPSENAKIYQLIKELELRTKVPITAPPYTKLQNPNDSSSNPSVLPTAKKESFDILRYWMAEQVRNPQMFRLAMVVYSAPSTQVSVERGFSALKLILTDHRQRLSDERIQELMVLKLNPDLLADIAKQLNAEMDE